MRRISVLLLTVIPLGAAPCPGWAADPKPPGISWSFDTRTGADSVPHSRVSLRVGARRIVVAASLEGEFSPVSRQEYQERRIPAAAVSACSGWWAGQGEDFYVIRRHGRWEVFRRDLDEQAPALAYRLVKTIPLH